MSITMMAGMLLSCSQRQDHAIANDQRNVPPSISPLFKLIAPEKSGVLFNNAITENDSINIIDYFYLYNGGGVAIGDFNNDGLADVFFTGNQVASRLYLNKGGLKFEDVTTEAGLVSKGWSTGVTLADINRDGYLDIYICRSGNYQASERSNILYTSKGINSKGIPMFEESAAAFGLNVIGYSTQSAFFDYDKDGDLDLYLLNTNNESRFSNKLMPVRANSKAESTDKLFRNDIKINSNKVSGTFVDVSASAGIIYEGLGLGVGIDDLNNDGWEDIYISNDFVGNDHLYINNHNGTFSERAGEYLKHQSSSAMGNDLADINNDGWTDIMVVDMLPPLNADRKRMGTPVRFEQFQMGLTAGYHPQYMRNTLQVNNGARDLSRDNPAVSFSEIGQLAGVHCTDWSWAPLLADFDNDGLKDLVVTNGYRHYITDLDFVLYGNRFIGNQSGKSQAEQVIKQQARQMPGIERINYVYKNNGDLTFDDKSTAWGFTQPSYSSGAAYGDLDNDGDLDLVINNVDAPAFLYENQTNTLTKNHYLTVRLSGHELNSFGFGADVSIYNNGEVQRRHQSVSRGFQSSVDNVIHFGMGTAVQIDSVVVKWPDGKIQVVKNINTNQLLTLDYVSAVKPRGIVKPAIKSLFEEATQKYSVNHRHNEDRYNDFARQFLLPHQHSRLGPGIAVGDVNNDGLDDFVVAGAYKQEAEVFIQTKEKFKSAPVASGDKYQEDMGLLLFDVDQDNDLDLYCVSGSNEFAPDSEDYLDRLFINNGQGKFKLFPSALPNIRSSGSCITAADYDQDGDLDVLIGGRLAPLNYPMPGTTTLLRNDTQTNSMGAIRFTDVTEQVLPSLKTAGMVTAALFTDFDQDHVVDLIVTGEFMPIRFFKNTDHVFKEVTNQTGLPIHNTGWWNSLNGADFDGDGDVDYIAGNAGLNGYYQVSAQEPLSIYASDFDANGSIDPIITHYLQGKEYPIHSRDEMIQQMISLRRKFITYNDYAHAQLTDIINPDDIKRAYVLQANQFASSYIENLGGGKFRQKPLPLSAQVSPIFGSVCVDVTADGLLDVVVIGNSYSPNVNVGRYDAGIGLLLKGDGKGNFEPIPHHKSGLFIDGDAKALALLTLANGNPLLLATQNDDLIKAFEIPSITKSKTIALNAGDAWAEILLSDGSKRHLEFYHGYGYLSQSSRRLSLPVNVKAIKLYNYAGQKREIDLAKL